MVVVVQLGLGERAGSPVDQVENESPQAGPGLAVHLDYGLQQGGLRLLHGLAQFGEVGVLDVGLPAQVGLLVEGSIQVLVLVVVDGDEALLQS